LSWETHEDKKMEDAIETGNIDALNALHREYIYKKHINKNNFITSFNDDIDLFVNDLRKYDAVSIACKKNDLELLTYLIGLGLHPIQDDFVIACECGSLDIVVYINQTYSFHVKIDNPHMNVYCYLYEKKCLSKPDQDMYESFFVDVV